MTDVGNILSNVYRTGLRVLAVLALLSLKLLLDDNMGSTNEVDVLPLAKQYADPSWIPGDWYLNQPPGYRLLFETLFGRLIVAWGFLATSVVGRLLCYALIASGLVLIGKRLNLNLALLLLAVGLFLYTGGNQGIAAYEWLLGGLEAKSVAYGLVLLAIAMMLEDSYCWMALMLGLATSFHVLVGGWAFIVVLAWLVMRWKTRLKGIQHLGLIVLIYLAASAFAIRPVVEQLFTSLPTSPVKSSYIYVFLRLPHHLNPLSWSSDWWLKPIVYLLLLAVSIKLLWRPQSDRLAGQHIARIKLFEFTLLSLLPFMLGLAVAPFDQSRLLQYYPFRLGDVMLPLNTCLLFACALQQTFTGRLRQVLLLLCVVLLSGVCSIQAVSFHQQFLALRQFPQVNPEFKALCDWVRASTPTDATVVSPPVEFVEFSWLAERPTIAKFKLLPQNKAGILEWYERLRDLSGGCFNWSATFPTRDSRKEIKQLLTNGYSHLTTAQAEALMIKYQALYFMTGVEHQLNLPSTYHNSRYALYGRKIS